MKNIGTAVIKNFDALLDWQAALTLDEGARVVKVVAERVDELYPEFVHSSRTDTISYMIKNVVKQSYDIDHFLYSNHFGGRDDFAQRKWMETRESTGNTLRQYRLFHEEYRQSLNVVIWDDIFAYLYFGNPEHGIVIPNPGLYFEFVETPSLDDVPVAQLRARMGSENDLGHAILPDSADGRLTKASLKEAQVRQQGEVERLRAEMKRVERGETDELAKIKADIDRLQQQMSKKKQDLMIELEDKMADMEERVEQLQAQIYLLDSQIYAIRCLAGEVVNFAHIRSGQNAPDSEPVIIYQKLRFLDEDLGRMASIYQIDWENVQMFEEFLRHSPAALETFAPDKRCVSLVRMSKTNSTIGHSSKFPYSNLLENYEYYHGRTVGIIIRNGGNVYFGWTDEDRVHIKDDLIISRVTTEFSPAEKQSPFFHDKLYAKRAERKERQKERAEKMEVMEGIISRAFVFNILQGVVKNTDWLPLPDGINISKPSPYVRFSLADMCLEDHRFSDFNVLVERANKDIAAGDMILTMQYLRAFSDRYVNNDRGRGYADRTHDCAVADCSIYPVNLVEYGTPVDMIVYEEPPICEGDKSMLVQTNAKNEGNLREGAVVVDRYTKVDRSIYVSLEKTGFYMGEVAPRANFEVFPSEIINLTFMNSVWLTWAINTKNLGNWTLKDVNIEYAHAIRYLNTALDYIKRREAEEKSLIDAVDPSICADPNWPLLLSDWKFMLNRDPEKRSVRTITPFQAKRFAKWVAAGTPGRVNFGKEDVSEPRA